MNIVFIFYLIFLSIYVAFNAYAIFRISKIRIKGDITGLVLFIYAALIIAIIFTSLMFASRLSWGAIDLKGIF